MFWAGLVSSFAGGIIATGLLAVPVLASSAAYAVAEAFGWQEGLELHWREAKKFYAIIGIATLAGTALDFTPVDDYSNGLHLSAYAGAWQGLVEGLSGLDIESGQLAFRPKLPAHWQAYHFTLQFRGQRLRISVLGDDELEIRHGDRQLPTQRGEDGRIGLKEGHP